MIHLVLIDYAKKFAINIENGWTILSIVGATIMASIVLDLVVNKILNEMFLIGSFSNIIVIGAVIMLFVEEYVTSLMEINMTLISITLNASFNQVEQLKAVSTYDGAEIFEGISEKEA